MHLHSEVREVLSLYGVTLRDFVVMAAREWRARRVPESQGGVKVTVDGQTFIVELEDVIAAREAAAREAEQITRIGDAFADPAVRREYRRLAGRYHNANGFLDRIVQAGTRRHQVLDDGLRAPRHRTKGTQVPVPPQVTASIPRPKRT